MPSIEQPIQSIDGRIRELNREIASLEDARSRLTSNRSAPTATGTGEGYPDRSQEADNADRRKRTSRKEVLLAGSAEQLLAEGDGLTTPRSPSGPARIVIRH